MPAWFLSSKSDSSRPKRARRFLANLRLSLIPIDGDPGRVRSSPGRGRARKTDEDASGPETGRAENASRSEGAAHPALPTHARNAVEEWIPSFLLYGPPR